MCSTRALVEALCIGRPGRLWDRATIESKMTRSLQRISRPKMHVLTPTSFVWPIAIGRRPSGRPSLLLRRLRGRALAELKMEFPVIFRDGTSAAVGRSASSAAQALKDDRAFSLDPTPERCLVSLVRILYAECSACGGPGMELGLDARSAIPPELPWNVMSCLSLLLMYGSKRERCSRSRRAPSSIASSDIRSGWCAHRVSRRLALRTSPASARVALCARERDCRAHSGMG